MMTTNFIRSLKGLTSGPQSFRRIYGLLPEAIDSFLDNGDVFVLKKQGRTTTVGVLDGSVLGLGQGLLIKKFHYRGILDFAFRGLFFSRARRLWKINQRLFAKGLPVPCPVGYVRPSFRRKNSFFISIFMEDSQNLGYIYKQSFFREPDKLAVLLGKTITRWHMAGAVHGDLKWSNILVQRTDDNMNIFFVDLDQAKLYRKPNIKGIIKDLVRFYRYGLELGAEEWVDKEFFPEYMLMLPDNLKSKLDLDYIRKKALRDWNKKGQRKFHLQ